VLSELRRLYHVLTLCLNKVLEDRFQHIKRTMTLTIKKNKKMKIYFCISEIVFSFVA